MRRFVYFVLFFVFISVLTGCGKSTVSQNLHQQRFVAVLTVDGDLSDLLDYEVKELHRVLQWMDRDLLARLRKQDFSTSYLKNMKDYSDTMGDLFIVSVEYFNAGRKNRPRNAPDKGPSTLELKYKLLDMKGALVAEWRDGADSRRGGTYCARLLNKRAVKRLNKLYR